MLRDLSRNKKATSLILIGLAAFAYYRYSKMTAEEKTSLIDTLTNAGKNLLSQITGDGSKNEILSTQDTLN